MSRERFMREAFSLAYRAKGTTSPNPAVGAVIVKNGRIIARGATEPNGRHAEAVAIASVRTRRELSGASMYVTLEPCVRMYPGKKNPPCTDAIIASGIRSVFVGSIDTNRYVNGAGVKKLSANGIRTEAGLLADETDHFYRDYRRFISRGKPYVIVKYAMSMDGKIATRTGNSQWISSPASRAFAHEVRAYADAVLVGSGTYLADDPHLNVRHGVKKGRVPLRIVLTRDPKLPLTGRIFRDGGPYRIITDAKAAAAFKRRLPSTNVIAVRTSKKGFAIAELLTAVAKEGVMSIMIEGGGNTIASFIEAEAVDEVFAVIAPMIIGGKDAPSPCTGRGIARVDGAVRFPHTEIERIGGDIIVHAWKER